MIKMARRMNMKGKRNGGGGICKKMGGGGITYDSGQESISAATGEKIFF